MSHSHEKCCICKKKWAQDCNRSFFRIPKDERRKKQWSEILRMEISERSRICTDHFDESHIVINSKRKWLAPVATPCRNLGPPDPLAISESDHKNVKVRDMANLLKKEEFGAKTCKKAGTIKELVQTEPKSIVEPEPKSIVETLEADNRTLKEEIEKLNQKLLHRDTVLSNIRNIFTEGQIRKLMNPKHSRWMREDIANAIRLHANGAKAYSYLSNHGFPLPPVPMLEHWCRKIVIDEGFLSTSLGFFRHCAELTNEDKICVLAFKELNLEDEKRVQVAVAQGLWKSWKRPIFFNFEEEMQKSVLLSIIEKMHKATFTVVAVVSDIKKENVQLWRNLGVTSTQPWFAHPVNPQDKVYTFADATILLEGLRKQFIDPGLLYNNELLTANTISDIINHNLCSKLDLTMDHIAASVDGTAKLAAELFSSTTADALRECHTNGITLYKPSETADFIDFVSSWFDLMNSSVNSFSIYGKVPFGINLTEQKEILIGINKWLAYNIVPNHVVLEDFQEAIIISNTALALLHSDIMQKYGMTYILTNRLNFQELNHLFGAIRSKGEKEEPLTKKEFKTRLKKYIYAQNLMLFHGTTNLDKEAIIDHSSSSQTTVGDQVVSKRKSTEVADANNDSSPKKVFKLIEPKNELPQQNTCEDLVVFDGLSQQTSCEVYNNVHMGLPAQEAIELGDANNTLLSQAANKDIIIVGHLEEQNPIEEMSITKYPQHQDCEATITQPKIITVNQIPQNIIPIRTALKTFDTKKFNNSTSPRPAFRLIGGKIIKIPKVKIEILPEPKKPASIIHEIVAERDPVILDEMDTANVHDVDNFVDDALKYISDYAYGEQK